MLIHVNTPFVEQWRVERRCIRRVSWNWGWRDASCGSRADLFGRRCVRCWSLPQRRVVGLHLSLPDRGFVAVGTIHLQPISAPSAATGDAAININQPYMTSMIYRLQLIILPHGSAWVPKTFGSWAHCIRLPLTDMWGLFGSISVRRHYMTFHDSSQD